MVRLRNRHDVCNLLLTLPLIAGYDLVASTWFALAGPKGLPNEIVQRLNQDIGRIMQLPDVQKKLAQDAFDWKAMTPAALSAFMASETTRWQPIAQAAGMKK